MRYKVIDNFRIKTSKCELDLSEGQIIKLAEDKATELLQAGKIRKQVIYYEPSTEQPIWKNPYPAGTPEARQVTLQETMLKMVQTTCDRIIEEHKKIGIASYVSNSGTKLSEDEITRIYQEALAGKAKLSDYKQACDNWLKVALNQLT